VLDGVHGGIRVKHSRRGMVRDAGEALSD
jgi:hypothetical protein